MNRRQIISSFAVLTTIAFTANAQPAARKDKVLHLGLVHPQSPSTATRGLAAFRDHLRELGYIEGQNLTIETRWAEGHTDRLPALIADVLARRVDVLVTYATQATLAAKNATSDVQIVGVALGDPVSVGLAPSVARPGGNVTGLAGWWADEGIASKWVQLLREIVPNLSRVAVIVNLETPIARDLKKELEATHPVAGPKLHFLEAHEVNGLPSAFDQAAKKCQGVLVLPSIVYSAHRWQLTALAEEHKLPTMYYMRDFVDAGGLVSYGSDLSVTWQRAADYVDKIVNGTKAGDLPFEQPRKLELVLNLNAARALKLTIPESILLRADEVIR